MSGEAGDHAAEAEEGEDGLRRRENTTPKARPSQLLNNPAMAPLFPMPPSASTLVTSHFDAILECQDLLSCMEGNPSVEKQDVIDSIRSMLNTMLSTVMMHNFSTSMSVQGWRVQ